MTAPVAQPPHVEQEDENVPLRRVLVTLLATIGVAVAAGCVAWLLLRTYERDRAPLVVPGEVPSGISHGLASVERRGQRLAAEADSVLATYGWVDRERGIVRIPIERAIAIVASRATPLSKGGQ
jgi:hypothetical protein